MFFCCGALEDGEVAGEVSGDSDLKILEVYSSGNNSLGVQGKSGVLLL